MRVLVLVGALLCAPFCAYGASLSPKDCSNGVPGKVRNLRQTSATESSMKVEWDPPEDTSCVKAYQIEVVGVITLSAGLATEIEVSNLKPCTSYDVNVLTIGNDDIKGETSSLKSTGAPPRPDAVEVSVNSQTSATITWKYPEFGDCITGYQILDEDEKVVYSTVDELTYTADSLSSCTSYNWSVISLFDEIKSIATPAEINTLPEKITGLKQTESGENFAKIAWDEIDCDIKEYNVNYNGKDYSTKEPNFDFEGLEACSVVEVKVTVVAASGMSVEPSEIDVTTTTGSVKEVSITNIMETSAKISWIKPNSDSCIEGYRIKDADGKEIAVVDASKSEYTINDLLGCSSYEVFVAAITNDFESQAAGASFNTNPGKVSNLKIVEMNDTTASLSWEAPKPDTCITEYRLTINDKQYTSKTTEYVIPDLSGCQSYEVEVKAYGNSQESEGDSLAFSTMPGQIKDLVIEDLTEEKVVLSWTAPTPSGCIDGYRIENNGEVVGTTKETKFEVNGLTPCQNYKIDIIAIGNGFDGGRLSTEIQADPGQVHFLTQTGSDLTTVSVEWDSPEHPECIESFHIFYDGKLLEKLSAQSYNYTVTELLPCTKGLVAVMAVSEQGNSGPTFEIDVKTSSVTTIGQVKNLQQIDSTAQSATISWEAPEHASCIVEYDIYFNSATFTTVDATHLSYELSHFDMCTKGHAGVAAVLESGAHGELVEIDIETTMVPECLLPGEVINLMQRNTTETAITIDWDPPNEGTEVGSYSILFVGNEVDIISKTQEHYTFKDLQACTRYDVAVAAVTKDLEYGPYKNITPKAASPEQILGVEQYKVVVENDSMVATWRPPTSHVSCVTAYRFVIWSHDELEIPTEVYDQSKNTLVFKVSPIAGCRMYNMGVKSMMGLQESPMDTFTYTGPPKVMEAPSCSRLTIKPDSVTFNCKTQTFSENACTLQKLKMTCTPNSLSDNERTVVYEENVVDNPTRPTLKLTVKGLKPQTKYECSAILINEAGTSEPSRPIIVTTSTEMKRRIKREVENETICDVKIMQNVNETTENLISARLIFDEEKCNNLSIFADDEKLENVEDYSNIQIKTTACSLKKLTVKSQDEKILANEVLYSSSYKVQKLTYQRNENKITISWEDVENSCANAYRINAENNESTKDVTGKEHSYTKNEVNFCETVIIYVASLRENKIVGEKSSITIHEAPKAVENLKPINQTENSLEVKWSNPNDVCFKEVLATVDSHEMIVQTDTAKNKEALEVCKMHNVIVKSLPDGNETSVNVLTRPNEVLKNLSIDDKQEEQNSILLKWTLNKPEFKNCIDTYILTINNDENKTKINDNNQMEYSLNNVICPAKVQLSSKLIDDSTSNTVDILVQGKTEIIINQEAIDKNSAKVFWQLTNELMEKCVTSYKLNIDGKEIELANTVKEHLIEDIINCNSFVSITAILNENVTIKSKEIIVYPDFTQVSFNLTQKEATINSATIKWDVEFNFTKCVQYFTLNSNEVKLNNEETEYEIKDVTCEKDVNLIATFIDNSNKENNLTVYSKPKNVENIQVEKNAYFAKITWDSSECDYSYLVNDIKEVELTDNYYEFQTIPCKSYNITIQAKNNFTTSDEEYAIFKAFNSGKPPIFDMYSYEITNKGFVLKWEEPVNNGCNFDIKNYTVVISDSAALHFIPEDCENEEEFKPIEIHTKERSFEFIDGKPNYNYSGYIIANTFDEYSSDPVDFTVDLFKAEPSPPRNVSVEMYDEFEKNVINTTFYWQYPCKPNGQITYFILKLQLLKDDSYLDESIHSIPVINGEEEVDYNFTLALLPYRNYIYSVGANNSLTTTFSDEEKFETPEGYPGPPTDLTVKENVDTLDISWNKPKEPNGLIINYNLVINGERAFEAEECNWTPITLNRTLNDLSYNYSIKHGYFYTLFLSAITSKGKGEESLTNLTTTFEVPDSVTDINYEFSTDESLEKYNCNVTISFKRPCNAPVNNYSILISEINHFADKNWKKITEMTTYTFPIEYKEYNLIIIPANDRGNGSKVDDQFHAPSGVPPVQQENGHVTNQQSQESINLQIKKSIFNEDYGKIEYLAIIVGDLNGKSFGYWEENEWPSLPSDSNAYYATPKKWAPFQNTNEITFKIGNDSTCASTEYCNRLLKPSTSYKITIRGFTKRAYKDYTMTIITLDLPCNVGTILGIVFGILGALGVSGLAYFYWRRNIKQKNTPNTNVDIKLGLMPAPLRRLSCNNSTAKDNMSRFKNEYNLIQTKSNEQNFASSYAQTLANKKKNRYVNIMPFDHTRVILKDAEDDYINASYIKGFEGKVEYIATQGPLESTVHDFWRMVIQENVHLIVMVAQFVEQNKEKVYKYFPDNQTAIEIEDIDIRCMNELNFGWYCLRTIQLQREDKKLSITHLQFLDWPDHGCPAGTNNILEFVQIIQQYQQKYEDYPTLVHCSAGVGRTGTIIALDILIQSIKNNKKADIFGTVSKLREQRVKMVQTEKQYFYLYECIEEYLKNPQIFDNNKGKNEEDDPIYANITR